jgi:hypothetical protein
MFQCFDGLLNACLDKCLEIITLFDVFIVQHVTRDEIIVANDLAQQASGLDSPVFSQCSLQQFVLLNRVQQKQMVQFLKPEGPKFQDCR